MSGWSGWQADIIVAVGGANTAELRNFLTEWQRLEPSSCRDNPMLASHRSAGSSNCKTLPNGKRAQAYQSQTQGRNATVAQIKSGAYPSLLAVFTSGSPFTPLTGNQGLYNDLLAWGVPTFAAWYRSQFGSQWGNTGGSSSGGVAPQAHQGWNSLRQSINRELPAALAGISRNQQAALRELGHRRRVRR